MTTRTPTDHSVTPPEDRWTEIRTIQKEHISFYQFLGGGILVLIGIFIGGILFGSERPIINTDNLLGYATNLYTEGVSIIVTVVILNRLAARRAEKEKIEELVRQVRSGSNDFARFAINELREKGLLEGEKGVLHSNNLSRADLRGIDLSEVNLDGANFVRANLENTNLLDSTLRRALMWDAILIRANVSRVDLSYADLLEANLTEADLLEVVLANANLRRTKFVKACMWNANLSNAKLWRADLTAADLWRANLQNAELIESNLSMAELKLADLRGTNLEGANLNRTVFSSVGRYGDTREAYLDETTILPDGTHYDPALGLEQLLRFGVVLNHDPSKDAGEGGSG